jgi:anti-sigma B factor antagonist
MSEPEARDDFRFEQHGEIVIIVPSPAFELMDPGLIAEAAEMIAEPLRGRVLPLLLVDLSEVSYFGSAFLSLLLKCWNVAQAKGGQLVLAGVQNRARELLHITSLDMVWPIYATRQEAIEALLSD